MGTIHELSAEILSEYENISQEQREEIAAKIEELILPWVDGLIAADEPDVVYDRYGRDINELAGY